MAATNLILVPGRELDALVADEVMGWKTHQVRLGQYVDTCCDHGRVKAGDYYTYKDADSCLCHYLPGFSTETLAAISALEKLVAEREMQFSIFSGAFESPSEPGFGCALYDRRYAQPNGIMPVLAMANHPTIAGAVSAATLIAVGFINEKGEIHAV